MTGVPPSKLGAVITTRSRCDDGSMFVIVGASGVRDGVALRELLEVPEPAALTARIRTVYSVPLLSPVIDQGEVVDAGDRMVQFVPSSEYS